MRVMDVVSEAKGAMRASEVFGTPYEKNGVTIIPAARISGGAGGGGNEGEPQAGGVGSGFPHGRLAPSSSRAVMSAGSRPST